MKNKFALTLLLSSLLFSLLSLRSYAQLPGFINRQATTASGRLVLDPNSDGYTSASTVGFGNDDVANSEIIYTGIRAYSIEPFGDLRRGANHNFSDFVPDASGNGVYHFFSTGNNILFRMRMGSVMPGSKGYSIMMDTDGKFGATGANADPNYQTTTNGSNGNPGFEIEIVLETNFRIAIYNVDGTSSPVLVKQYINWQEMSQVSIASTNDNGDPDFLIDFYIPFADLQAAPFNLTASSSIRLTATTVMAPKAAIGGPRSDIYGTAGDTYENFIIGQPVCNIFNNPVTCQTAMCTAAPTVNAPISTGTTTISGTWTKSLLAGAAGTANITIYKNGSSIGTVSGITSGGTWAFNNVSLVNGDIITAKAQASGETMCLTSNAVIASTCNATNQPATPILTCTSSSKGLEGTNLSNGWTLHVNNITRNIFDNNVTNATGLFGTSSGTSPNIVWQYSGGCTTGAPLTSGSYKVYYVDNVTGCNSLPAYFCAAGNGNTALAGSLVAPVITTPLNSVFTTATNSIAGTTDANATLFLYINGTNVQTTTATSGGVFSFSGLNLLTGQQLYIVTELNTGTVSSSKCANQTPVYTVTCFTQPPLINSDNNNQLSAATFITGTSAEPAGSTIRIYTSTNTLVATTTVQANGTWSTGNAGTLPTNYNAVAATSYYANAQNGTCGVSTNSGTYAATVPTSATRCGSITGPITSGVTSISGSLTGSFSTTTVNLYLDGELIGTSTTTNTAWGPISVNTTPPNTLYSNGILKIGIQESGKQEVACPASALAIVCTPSPTVPAYTLSSSSVNQYETVTCTISNAVAGTFYALSDSATGQSYGQGKWATSNGTLVLTSNAFIDANTYKVKVNGTSISGLTLCSAVSATGTIVVNPGVVLPLSLIEFKGKKLGAGILLEWTTENEIQSVRFEIERSNNGTSFYNIGRTNAAGIAGAKTFYSHTDLNPAASKNYYRLKMIDTDGKFSYSKVIVFSGAESILISNVSPNPFTNKIVLTINLERPVQLQLQIIDLTGRIMITKTVNGIAGSNNIQWNELNKLAEGIYYINTNRAEASLQQKLLKVN